MSGLFTCRDNLNRKSQVLIIFLWILSLLAVITVSLGDKIAMVLKFTRAQRDLLKADCLAYAGINRAISELKKDNPDYDGITDTWVDNKDAFEKIRFTDNPEEYAAIINQEKFGIIDEERKININKAPKELLLALMEYYNIPAPEDIVNNILIWRGNVPDSANIYEGLGYPAKARPYANIAELMLVKGMDEESFGKIAKVITVYGEGKININTADQEIIRIFCRSLAKELPCAESYADAVTDKFITLRNTQLAFQDKTIINLGSLPGDEANILERFINAGDIKSNHFLIEVEGNEGRIKKRIAAIYNRTQDCFKGWYEGQR